MKGLLIVIVIDLKPENIGFRADKKLKFFVFGLAACVRKKVFANEVYKMMAYVAPVTLRKPYNEKVDINSFLEIWHHSVTGKQGSVHGESCSGWLTTERCSERPNYVDTAVLGPGSKGTFLLHGIIITLTAFYPSFQDYSLGKCVKLFFFGDITIPYLSNESTVDEFSVVRKDSICGSRVISLQQAPTNPLMKLSSLNSWKVIAKDIYDLSIVYL